jgi:2-iminoacetate synthase
VRVVAEYIDESAIERALARGRRCDAVQVREVLARAHNACGLSPDDVAVLLNISSPELLEELFSSARAVKEHIYGRRLVLFAPLYVSNLCSNECLYCAFRVRNKEVRRKVLTQEEIASETRALIDQGHKRVLLVAGESYPHQGFRYILDAVDTIYSVSSEKGEIRRVNVNIAPLTIDEFKLLKEHHIGTYQIFQETYHRQTYEHVHLAGRKKDYDWRVTSTERAMEAGIDDVGIGILFGLFDWRWEILAMLQHIKHLNDRFGIGPHTISMPRLEPAVGSEMSLHPPHPISDLDFRKLVAIVRLAVPYTGIIMSTRETANIRRETFALGVSQISAGSRTSPGGYGKEEKFDESQFSLGDHRSLDEVIRDITELGYIPSFCTACYRLGRTGRDFMDLARPGDIKRHCDPNALGTFLEYLHDYASPETKQKGLTLINQILDEETGDQRRETEQMLNSIRLGKRDLFV